MRRYSEAIKADESAHAEVRREDLRGVRHSCGHSLQPEAGLAAAGRGGAGI